MIAGLIAAVSTLLVGMAMVGAIILVGRLAERRWPGRKTDGSSVILNYSYYAPMTVLQSVLRPGAAAMTVPLVNALGGGLIVLPAHGVGLVVGAAVYLLAMDFGEYVFHRAQHASPTLWAMHSLHHSDEHFNISTAHRHFWFENCLKSVTIFAIVGLLFKTDPAIIAIYGLISYYNSVSHMNVRLGFGRWSWILNSPQYHRLHHSARLEDRDQNFAALLPIFDVLFGAYRRPLPGEYPPTGLDEVEPQPTLVDVLIWPARRLIHTRTPTRA